MEIPKISQEVFSNFVYANPKIVGNITSSITKEMKYKGSHKKIDFKNVNPLELIFESRYKKLGNEKYYNKSNCIAYFSSDGDRENGIPLLLLDSPFMIYLKAEVGKEFYNPYMILDMQAGSGKIVENDPRKEVKKRLAKGLDVDITSMKFKENINFDKPIPLGFEIRDFYSDKTYDSFIGEVVFESKLTEVGRD